MKIIAIVLALCLLAFSLSFAGKYGEFDEYLEMYRNRNETYQEDEDLVKNWAEGIWKGYQAKLDHLQISFDFDEGKRSDDRVVLLGTLSITAFCIKNGNKMRITQKSEVAILFENKEYLRSITTKEGGRHIVEPGWFGNPI